MRGQYCTKLHTHTQSSNLHMYNQCVFSVTFRMSGHSQGYSRLAGWWWWRPAVVAVGYCTVYTHHKHTHTHSIYRRWMELDGGCVNSARIPVERRWEGGGKGYCSVQCIGVHTLHRLASKLPKLWHRWPMRGLQKRCGPHLDWLIQDECTSACFRETKKGRRRRRIR